MVSTSSATNALRFPSAAPPLAAIAAAAIAAQPLHLEADTSIPADSSATLLLASGERLSGALTILRFFGRVSTRDGFYSSDPIHASQVDEWVEFSPVFANGAEFERMCAYIDSYLAFRTFLVGYDLSIADVAVWVRLQASGPRWESICKSPTAKYPNLIRWFVTLHSSFPELADAIAPLLPNRKGAGGAAKKSSEPLKSKELKDDKSSGDKPADLELPGAVMGQVVTRFPPEPSGYLHIGHAKAALMNQFFAEKYNGTLLIRFDDTNPSKEKDEYVESIMDDLARLGVQGAQVSYTSDYFPQLQDMAERMIKEGKAYVDDTPVEKMREERMSGIESKNRNNSVETNLALWKEILTGSPKGLECCLRGKMDMQAANKTLRDPVYYRCNLVAHHRTGTKYKAYPTYDFACPFVDSIEGVTHALRSSEYHDRNDQFYWVLKDMGLRRVEVWDFSRLNFQYTLLSKRKLQWFVENGRVEGWHDPRFPTVQGLLRRGLTVEALKQFIFSQGASKNLNLMEMDKLWTINKRIIDPVCPRHTCVISQHKVKLTLTDGPEAPFVRVIPRHKKYPPAGKKATWFAKDIWIDQADAEAVKEGEEVTLMDWGNAIVRKVVKDEETGLVVGLEGVLNLDGSVKTTKLKLTWLADMEELVPLTLVELDYLITKKKLEEDEDFTGALSPTTRWEFSAVGDPNMRNLQRGEILQLERKGYFICDSPLIRSNRPIILISIPDGRQRPPPGEFNPKF